MGRKTRSSDDPPRRPQPPRLSSINRWVLIISGLGIALLVIGWRLQSRPMVEPSVPAAAAAADIDAAVRRAEECERARDEVGLEGALQTLIALDPDSADWRLKLCRLQSRQGRSVEAVETCRTALQREISAADAAELRLRLAEESIKLGNAAEARRALTPLQAQGAAPPMFTPLWARMLRLEGKSDEALAFLLSTLPPNHENASAYQALGMLKFDLGRYPEAFADFQAAGALDPYDDVTQFKLAECARLLGDRTAELEYRRAHGRLRGVRLEIDRLTGRYHREKTLSQTDAARLAELYAAIGQTDYAAFWQQKAAAANGRR